MHQGSAKLQAENHPRTPSKIELKPLESPYFGQE